MIYIVLPAYNEEQSIGKLLDAFVAMGKNFRYQVIIVDDGSTDHTKDESKVFKKKLNLHIISHKVNLGLPAAINTGFKQVLKEAKPEDIIITMDADYTHHPQPIPKMISKLQNGKDVVIASRFQAGSTIYGVSSLRKMLSHTSSIIFRLLFPIKNIKDYTCGYRAYKVKILDEAYSFYKDRFISQKGFSCMVDILLKLRRFNIKADETPFALRYDLKIGKSKMNVGKTVIETFILLIKRRMGEYF